MYSERSDEMVNKVSDDNPLKETAEDRIERELQNIYHINFTLDSRLNNIETMVEANMVKTEILEEAISHLTYLPSYPIKLSFNHKTHELTLQKNLKMPIEGKMEAKAISYLFKKTDGTPFKKRVQCKLVARDITLETGKKCTVDAVFQTMNRIKNKLERDYSLGRILQVSRRDYYIPQNNR